MRVISGRRQAGVEMVLSRDYPSTKGGQQLIVRLKFDSVNTDVFAPERLEPTRAGSPH